VVWVFLCLSTFTRPDIAFTISILTRHSAHSTLWHWNDIKYLRYLKRIEDLVDPKLVGYYNVGYKFDPAMAKSQIDYVFLLHRAAICWNSVKQIITATSSNHAKNIAIHEASQECIWLKLIDKLIGTNCRLPHDDFPIVLYKLVLHKSKWVLLKVINLNILIQNILIIFVTWL